VLSSFGVSCYQAMLTSIRQFVTYRILPRGPRATRHTHATDELV